MGRKRIYASATERKQRAQRARDRANAAHRLDAPTPAVVAVVDHADPVGALAEWSRKTLIVPPGHARSGEPMALPDFAVKWLTEHPGTRMNPRSRRLGRTQNRRSRRSSVSATCAVHCRRPGWRGAIASLDKNKAGELRRQVADIAQASGLDVKVRRYAISRCD